jgi:hypothetical protein
MAPAAVRPPPSAAAGSEAQAAGLPPPVVVHELPQSYHQELVWRLQALMGPSANLPWQELTIETLLQLVTLYEPPAAAPPPDDEWRD